jgi:hypothetical protein
VHRSVATALGWISFSFLRTLHMPIRQVTHINHAEPQEGTPVVPSDVLAQLAAAEERLGAHGQFFVKNPKLVMEDAVAVKGELERGRNSLEITARASHAEDWKGGANALFGEGKAFAALVGYSVGIWYLREGRSPFPMSLAHAVASARGKDAEYSTKSLAELAAWLGALHNSVAIAPGTGTGTGTGAGTGGVAASAAASAAPEEGMAAATDGSVRPSAADAVEDAYAGAVARLRTSLLLNAAAAALKLSLWAIAKAACEQVLLEDATSSKALFRLAKAHEGEDDKKAAISVLLALCKREPKNTEARRLLEAIKTRQAEEKEKFKALF